MGPYSRTDEKDIIERDIDEALEDLHQENIDGKEIDIEKDLEVLRVEDEFRDRILSCTDRHLNTWTYDSYRELVHDLKSAHERHPDLDARELFTDLLIRTEATLKRPPRNVYEDYESDAHQFDRALDYMGGLCDIFGFPPDKPTADSTVEGLSVAAQDFLTSHPLTMFLSSTYDSALRYSRLELARECDPNGIATPSSVRATYLRETYSPYQIEEALREVILLDSQDRSSLGDSKPEDIRVLNLSDSITSLSSLGVIQLPLEDTRDLRVRVSDVVGSMYAPVISDYVDIENAAKVGEVIKTYRTLFDREVGVNIGPEAALSYVAARLTSTYNDWAYGDYEIPDKDFIKDLAKRYLTDGESYNRFVLKIHENFILSRSEDTRSLDFSVAHKAMYIFHTVLLEEKAEDHHPTVRYSDSTLREIGEMFMSVGEHISPKDLSDILITYRSNDPRAPELLCLDVAQIADTNLRGVAEGSKYASSKIDQYVGQFQSIAEEFKLPFEPSLSSAEFYFQCIFDSYTDGFSYRDEFLQKLSTLRNRLGVDLEWYSGFLKERVREYIVEDPRRFMPLEQSIPEFSLSPDDKKQLFHEITGRVIELDLDKVGVDNYLDYLRSFLHMVVREGYELTEAEARMLLLHQLPKTDVVGNRGELLTVIKRHIDISKLEPEDAKTLYINAIRSSAVDLLDLLHDTYHLPVDSEDPDIQKALAAFVTGSVSNFLTWDSSSLLLSRMAATFGSKIHLPDEAYQRLASLLFNLEHYQMGEARELLNRILDREVDFAEVSEALQQRYALLTKSFTDYDLQMLVALINLTGIKPTLTQEYLNNQLHTHPGQPINQTVISLYQALGYRIDETVSRVRVRVSASILDLASTCDIKGLESLKGILSLEEAGSDSLADIPILRNIIRGMILDHYPESAISVMLSTLERLQFTSLTPEVNLQVYGSVLESLYHRWSLGYNLNEGLANMFVMLNLDPKKFGQEHSQEIYLMGLTARDGSVSLKILEGFDEFPEGFNGYALQYLTSIIENYLLYSDAGSLRSLLTRLKDTNPKCLDHVTNMARSRLDSYCSNGHFDNGSIESIIPIVDVLYEDAVARREFYRGLVSRVVFDSGFMLQYHKLYELAGIEAQDFGVTLREGFLNNPKSVALGLDSFASNNSKLSDLLRKDPWAKAIRGIRKIYRDIEGTDEEAWEKDIPNLLKALRRVENFRIDDPKTPELLLAYIKRFGLESSSELLQVYFELYAHVNDKQYNLSGNTKRLLGDIGVNVEGLPPIEIVGKFEKYVDTYKRLIIRDIVPPYADSELGYVLLITSRGKSSWERGGVSRAQDVLKNTAKTIESNPDVFAVPRHMVSHRFEVPLRVSEGNSDDSAIIELLSTNEATELYRKPLEGYYKAAAEKKTTDELRSVFTTSLSDKISILLSKVAIDPVYKESLLSAHTEQEALQIIESFLPGAFVKGVKLTPEQKAQSNILRAVVESITARADIENSSTVYYGRVIEKVDDIRSRIGSISSQIESAKGKGKDTTKLELEMSALSEELVVQQLIITASAERSGMYEEVALLEIAASHNKSLQAGLLKEASLQVVTGSLPQPVVATIGYLYNDIDTPSSDQIRTFTNILTSHIAEGFMFNTGGSQDILSRSGHIPFTNNTYNMIRQALSIGEWNNAGGNEIPVYQLVRKIEALEEGATKSSKLVDVSMVPVGGIGRTIAPYCADMCATSQDLDLSRGLFPDVKAYMYVVSEGTSKEKVVGSTFIINALGEDGVPVYVLRGNNPTENFINAVDNVGFLREVLRHSIDDVRRLAKTSGGAARLAIPMDGRGSSTTNRDKIVEARDSLIRNGSSLQKIGLVETPSTTFNQYRSFDKRGYNAVHLLFEVLPDGTEKWYGSDNIFGIGSEWPYPSLSLEQLDGNKGREIAGIETASAGFRVLPSVTLEVKESNASIISSRKPEEFALFIDPVGYGHEMVVRGIDAPHWRSVTSEIGKSETITYAGGDNDRVPYFEVNTKGAGYTKPSAKGVNFAGYDKWYYVKPGDETNNGVRILGCMLEWEDFVEKSTSLVNSGLRCELGWATYKPHALPYRGELKSIEWLRTHDVLPNDPDSEPYIIVRLLKSNTRVEEARRSDSRRHDIFENAFETYNKEREFSGEARMMPGSRELQTAYFKHFFRSMGSNIGTLLNIGQIHTALHSSNISMAAEIVDIDTVGTLEEHTEYKQELAAALEGIPYGFLLDMIDCASSSRSLILAAQRAGVKSPPEEELAAEFMQSLESVLSSNRLSGMGITKDSVRKWYSYILTKILIQGANPSTLKTTNFEEWS